MVLFLVRRLAAGVLVVFATAVFAYGGWRWLRADDLFAGQPLVSSTWAEIRAAPAALWHTPGLWADVWMVLGTLAFGVLVGVPAGSWCAAHAGTRRARALEAVATAGLCAPPFVAGFGLLLLFDQRFGLVPVPFFFDISTYAEPWEHPWDWLRSMLAPWVIAGLPVAAICLRLTKSGMREAAGEDWLRTATAKGVAADDVWRRHARPAAHPTVLSYLSVSAAGVLLNIVMTETVFSVPGLLGRMREALGDSGAFVYTGEWNVPVLQLIAVWMAVLVVVIGIAADLALARRDPRVRARGRIG